MVEEYDNINDFINQEKPEDGLFFIVNKGGITPSLEELVDFLKQTIVSKVNVSINNVFLKNKKVYVLEQYYGPVLSYNVFYKIHQSESPGYPITYINLNLDGGSNFKIHLDSTAFYFFKRDSVWV